MSIGKEAFHLERGSWGSDHFRGVTKIIGLAQRVGRSNNEETE